MVKEASSNEIGQKNPARHNVFICIISDIDIHSACIWATFKECIIYTLKSHSECYGKRVSTDNIDKNKAVST